MSEIVSQAINIVLTASVAGVAWSVRTLIKTVWDNTRTIEMLSRQVDDIHKEIVKIPRLEKNLGDAHLKIRELKELVWRLDTEE